jgi:hypothetical protein
MNDHHHNATLERLLGPTGDQVTCEQCFELLDEYVDLEAAGHDADARVPGMRTHLEGCPACNEDSARWSPPTATDQSGATIRAASSGGQPRSNNSSTAVLLCPCLGSSPARANAPFDPFLGAPISRTIRP